MSRNVITALGPAMPSINENARLLRGKDVTGANGYKATSKAITGKGNPAISKARGLRPRDANQQVAAIVQANAKQDKAITNVNSDYSSTTGRRISKIPAPSSKAVEQCSKQEEECGYSARRLPASVEDIDVGDGDNVFLAPEFVVDIYDYLRMLEVKQCVPEDFLSIQKEMTPKMRSVLVDWLVNVHAQFRLLPETLYLGMSVMDRFFASEVVCKDKIQLVGVTAFFIAAKFEEIYPPTIDDLVSICDNLYGRRDIIKMEMVMVRRLRFELGRPLPLHFLRRYSKAAHASPKIHTLAKFLMELTLLDHECSSWSPSLQAATALFVTLKVLSDDPNSCWTPTLEYYSNYKECNLEACATKLCSLVFKSETSKYQNVRKKYSHPKMMEISKSPVLKCDYIQTMAQTEMES